MADETVSVSRSVVLPAPARDVWGVIGGFQELHRWHPAVADCTKESVGEHEFRHLDLEGGGAIVEQLLNMGPHSYSYRIVKSPLPVEHYEARIEVNDKGGQAEVTWSSSFSPTGPDAEAVIAGIYEAGFAALKERFPA